MTNSDNSFGTYNKITKIVTQHTSGWDGSTANNIISQSWADVDAAKSHVYTDAALALINACATNLQWAIVNDRAGGNNNSLKWTADFGIPANPATKSWAEKFKDDKASLQSAGNWYKEHLDAVPDGADNSGATKQCPRKNFHVEESSDHLF